MATRWTEADLQVIAEAVGEGFERGTEALREHFGPQGGAALAMACQAADDLAAGRAVEAGAGLVLSRDVPDGPTGRALRATESESYAIRDFS